MNKNKLVYLYTFTTTTIILVIIAIFSHFAPFGKESMLTVDLGQQYIDFFAQFKYTILHNPSELFYSFKKGIGGEMVGIWAYYLLSPFNLVFLFLDEKHFVLGIQIITYLKLVSTSLSFCYFIHNKYKTESLISCIFSMIYALMSYSFVFLLNIMWLDALILLPIIAYGLDLLISSRKIHLYTISLALLLTTSFYIGYMICIFLVFYSLFVIIENNQATSFKSYFKSYSLFIICSFSSVLISSFVLFPTYHSLIHSKVTHPNLEIGFKATYSLIDIGSKLFIGAFNFDELAAGSPNLFTSSLITIFMLLFFFSKQIRWQEKLIACLIISILISSLYFDSLNQIWHGGQFPVWYEYRFSFLLSFFAVTLAAKAFQTTSLSLVNVHILACLLIGQFLFEVYYFTLISQSELYSYLDASRLFLTLTFFVAYILILFANIHLGALRKWLLLLLVMSELFTNGILILNELSYVDQSKFNDYTERLNKDITPIRAQENQFYRVHKTYQRTKDEAFYTNYYGLDNFSSTIETSTTNLFTNLGLPATKGFVNYTNGTLFTDDFFNIKYIMESVPNANKYLQPEQYYISPSATDLDNATYPIIKKDKLVQIRENTQRFGLGMEVNKELLSHTIQFVENNPIANQEMILNLIDFNNDYPPFYKEVKLSEMKLNQIKITDKGDGDFYTYERAKTTSDVPNLESLSNTAPNNLNYTVSLNFDTTSKDPYYFTMPSQFNNKNINLFLNKQEFIFYSPLKSRQVLNASFNKAQAGQILTYKINTEKIQANLFKLYQFNLDSYKELVQRSQSNQLQINYFSPTLINGTIDISQKNASILFIIPYDSNWLVSVDNKPVQTKAVLSHSLLAIPINKGHHIIQLRYSFRNFYMGVFISACGILLFLILQNILNHTPTKFDKSTKFR